MKKDIVELRHQLQKIESDKLYLEECIERLHEVESALRQAEKQLKKETRDVEKLNTASVASILAFFAKDKEERLVKEEQEALQAALHVRQLQENAKAPVSYTHLDVYKRQGYGNHRHSYVSAGSLRTGFQ